MDGVGYGITHIAHDRAIFDCYYEFTIPSSLRIYHVYEDMWEATIRENLPCQRKLNNKHDPFAVAVSVYRIIVGVIAHRRNSTGNQFCGFARDRKDPKIYVLMKFSWPMVCV